MVVVLNNGAFYANLDENEVIEKVLAEMENFVASIFVDLQNR